MPYTMGGYEYVDTGCKLHPSCLTCPLPRCVYDMPAKNRLGSYAYKVQKEMRDAGIRAARDAGIPVPEIAERFSMSRGTVYKVLAK